MWFKRLVAVVEALGLAAAVVFVVLLLGNDGGGTLSPAATIYDNSCAGCHGGDGGGGLGPQLAGEVEKRFPDIEEQIAFVTEGEGGMPGFGDTLSEDEIRLVVEYTRELGK
jgi:mono/diheme cytochrome c family protein